MQTTMTVGEWSNGATTMDAGISMTDITTFVAADGMTIADARTIPGGTDAMIAMTSDATRASTTAVVDDSTIEGPATTRRSARISKTCAARVKKCRTAEKICARITPSCVRTA